MTLPIEMFRFAKTVPGAISMTEAVALYCTIEKHLTTQRDLGYAADLGSHAGKSALVAAAAFQENCLPVGFYLVDLVYDLSNPRWKGTVQGSAERMPWWYVRDRKFRDVVKERVLRYADKDLNVVLQGWTSLEFFDLCPVPLNYVFIDTDDHADKLVMQETKKVEDRMLPGGLVFYHDFKNQYKGPRRAYKYLVSTGKYEAVPIDWGFAEKIAKEYQLEENNDSWHMPGVEFPAFIGCARRL